jgi:NAD/NADP transhydrogenase alpha subunit
VVVTAAQVFGRKAPIIVTSAVRPDEAGQHRGGPAVESGGNVEGLKYDDVLDAGAGGPTRLPGFRVERTNASEMLAITSPLWLNIAGTKSLLPA